MIRVLIAEDHHIVRQGVRALLEKQPQIEIVGEAKDGFEALALASRLIPDVLVLDINMPHLNGIEVISDIRAAGLKTACIILSMYSDETLVKRALQNGAWGYLLKNSIAEDLITAIESAYNKQLYLSPELREILSLEEIDRFLEKAENNKTPEPLTEREREICRMIAYGMTNSVIGNKLKISAKTVEKHRANLMAKLGVQDLAGLIRESIRRGIIFLDE
jgi:DNA-binding NarL/FixJ family response regulator